MAAFIFIIEFMRGEIITKITEDNKVHSPPIFPMIFYTFG